LERGREQPDAALALELHDDVSWEKDGTPTELLQIKHHVDATRGLGDKDLDLWKTLGIWMDAHSPADPGGPVLALVTTVQAPDGAARHLRPSPRDVSGARALLDIAAVESSNEATAAARHAFAGLGERDREVFLGRVYVLDGSPHLGSELEEAVKKALFFAMPPEHEESFLKQLWGWWNRQAVQILQRGRDSITAMEVRLQVQEIADGYKSDNLPTLIDRDDVNIDLEGTYGSHLFVEQLRWILHSSTMLQKAMVDYYRSYVQRGEWVDQGLIGIGELESFEDNLLDEWERAFDAMLVQMGTEPDDPKKEEVGHALFQELSNQTVVRVRERYTEPFFMRGRLHEFANLGRLGWHPDFEARVKELLKQ
jgi:hypothetical protein